MATTTVRIYERPKAITTTITDEAYVQLSGSGRHYVAGKAKDGHPVVAVHSNIGSSTVFRGFFVDLETYDLFKSAVKDADYQALESIIDALA